MKPGEWYDEGYFSGRGVKNSLSGAYTWDNLGGYFVGTAAHLRKWYHPETVVDFGCACGFLVRSLRLGGCSAIGLDHSAYAISQATPEIRPYIFQHDLTQPLPEYVKDFAPVDMVTCFDVLEHIDEADVGHVLENMLELNPTYIVCNVCVGSQPGFDHSHVNVRHRGYWHRVFMHYLHGYMPDEMHLDSNVWWFNDEETVFVYRRREHETAHHQ